MTRDWFEEEPLHHNRPSERRNLTMKKGEVALAILATPQKPLIQLTTETK